MNPQTQQAMIDKINQILLRLDLTIQLMQKHLTPEERQRVDREWHASKDKRRIG